MAVGTNWDNSTRNVGKHRVPLVSCERSRGSLRLSSLGGGGERGLNCVFEKENSLIKEVSSFQRLALGKEKVFLLSRCPYFRGVLTIQGLNLEYSVSIISNIPKISLPESGSTVYVGS